MAPSTYTTPAKRLCPCPVSSYKHPCREDTVVPAARETATRVARLLRILIAISVVGLRLFDLRFILSSYFLDLDFYGPGHHKCFIKSFDDCSVLNNAEDA